MRKRRPDPSFVASAGLGSRLEPAQLAGDGGGGFLGSRMQISSHSGKQCPKRMAKFTRRGFARARSFDCGPLSSGSSRASSGQSTRQMCHGMVSEVARPGKSLVKIPSFEVITGRAAAGIDPSQTKNKKKEKKKNGTGLGSGLRWGIEVLAWVPDGRVHGVGSECINQIVSLSQPRTTSNNVLCNLCNGSSPCG